MASRTIDEWSMASEMSLFVLIVLAIAGFTWALTALAGRRDLRAASVLLMLVGPTAAAVVLAEPGKPVVVAATLFPVAGLLIALARRRDQSSRLFSNLSGHPFSPFAFLYAACGVYGLAWALWRGNDPVLAAGQTFTAALFVFGFVVAGPVLASCARQRDWLLFVLAMAILSLPGLAAYSVWLEGPGEPVMVRFLEPTAFYAPLCALLALAVVLPRHKRVGMVLTGFFVLVTVLTFTRSYWLGLVVGTLVLLALSLSARGSGRGRRLRLPRKSELPVAVVVASLVAAVLVLTPVAPLALERGAQVREGSSDASVVVRGHELEAVIRQIRQTPAGGLGSGGEFVSLHHLDSSRVFFGPTNFVHNAYLYFPLKFGALGFAALFALLAGTVAMLCRSFRRVRSEGRSSAAVFPAVAVAILALSLTAPNLVDPFYSLFGGTVLFLAGIRPAARADGLTAPEATEAGDDSFASSGVDSPTAGARRRRVRRPSRRFPGKPYSTYVKTLEQVLEDVDSVLDVGCGRRSPLADVGGSFRSVGLDAHRPSLQSSREAGIHDDYIECQVTELDAQVGAFDAVVLLDLIEHLEREEGLALLDRAERIAGKRVVVSTPNGFVPQDGYGDNAWQVHRSGWTVGDFKARGYRVYGLNGPRALRGERGRLRGPRLLSGPLSVLLQPLVRRRPRQAFQLVAVKDLR